MVFKQFAKTESQRFRGVCKLCGLSIVAPDSYEYEINQHKTLCKEGAK